MQHLPALTDLYVCVSYINDVAEVPRLIAALQPCTALTELHVRSGTHCRIPVTSDQLASCMQHMSKLHPLELGVSLGLDSLCSEREWLPHCYRVAYASTASKAMSSPATLIHASLSLAITDPPYPSLMSSHSLSMSLARSLASLVASILSTSMR